MKVQLASPDGLDVGALADRLAAVHAACFTTPPPWSAASLAEYLAEPACLCHLSTNSGGAIEGFILTRWVLDEAEILTIAVLGAARAQGLGSVLVAAALRDLCVRGVRSVFLEVAPDNAPARALYARAGFAQTGRRKGYYGGADGLILRREMA